MNRLTKVCSILPSLTQFDNVYSSLKTVSVQVSRYVHNQRIILKLYVSATRDFCLNSTAWNMKIHNCQTFTFTIKINTFYTKLTKTIFTRYTSQK